MASNSEMIRSEAWIEFTEHVVKWWVDRDARGLDRILRNHGYLLADHESIDDPWLEPDGDTTYPPIPEYWRATAADGHTYHGHEVYNVSEAAEWLTMSTSFTKRLIESGGKYTSGGGTLTRLTAEHPRVGDHPSSYIYVPISEVHAFTYHRKLTTIEKACEAFGVSRSTITKRLREGELNGMQLGSAWRVFAGELKEVESD